MANDMPQIFYETARDVDYAEFPNPPNPSRDTFLDAATEGRGDDFLPIDEPRSFFQSAGERSIIEFFTPTESVEGTNRTQFMPTEASYAFDEPSTERCSSELQDPHQHMSPRHSTEAYRVEVMRNEGPRFSAQLSEDGYNNEGDLPRDAMPRETRQISFEAPPTERLNTEFSPNGTMMPELPVEDEPITELGISPSEHAGTKPKMATQTNTPKPPLRSEPPLEIEEHDPSLSNRPAMGTPDAAGIENGPDRPSQEDAGTKLIPARETGARPTIKIISAAETTTLFSYGAVWFLVAETFKHLFRHLT
ncbi:hypothetical protein QBC44DRAFT_394773 [Cladorrhinum sp. PSN332]|nr:hypothetical protein QBC44DRAFT_394773 [Cladorrhinum sp. PSN332]